MIERVYYVVKEGNLVPPPQPTENHWKESLRGFSSKFAKIAGRHFPVTREQFLMYYQGRKLTIYQQAVESLLTSPITRLDARLKTFVKAEKLNLSKKPDPAPRVIQPRSPRYNVELGKYLRPFEHKAFQIVEKIFGEPTVFKGYTYDQQAEMIVQKWNKYKDPVAIGLDASRFDQHVSKDALRWEHSLYNKAFATKELRELLKWQVTNMGVAFASDGMMKYTREGCRMSGDMNTSLGNCLLMCAMVWSLMETTGIKLSLCNNGDDCVIICEREGESGLRSSIEKHFLDFGFTMEVEPTVDVIEHIEFCQTHPINTGNGWTMVRDPRVAISKDLSCLLPIQTVDNFKEWMTAVGECGGAITEGVPLWGSFYNRLRSFKSKRTGLTTQGTFTTSGVYRAALHATTRKRPITPTGRFSFYLAYGITPDLQVALEDWYDSIELDASTIIPVENNQQSGNELIHGL